MASQILRIPKRQRVNGRGIESMRALKAVVLRQEQGAKDETN